MLNKPCTFLRKFCKQASAAPYETYVTVMWYSCYSAVLFIRWPFSIYRVVVLEPVLSDAMPRSGEPPLAHLTWQWLMERFRRFVSLTYTVASYLSQIVLPSTVIFRMAWGWGYCCHGNGDTVVMGTVVLGMGGLCVIDMSTVVIGMRIWLLWKLLSWEWGYCLHGNENTVGMGLRILY